MTDDRLDPLEEAIAELVRAAYEAELDATDRLTEHGKEDAA